MGCFFGKSVRWRTGRSDWIGTLGTSINRFGNIPRERDRSSFDLVLTRFLPRTSQMNMAEEALAKALSTLNIRREGKEIVLKEEQETALIGLLRGQDVVAVLPTGFGKSMIFTVFALADRIELFPTRACVLVISPLKSIIDAELRNVGTVV